MTRKLGLPFYERGIAVERKEKEMSRCELAERSTA